MSENPDFQDLKEDHSTSSRLYMSRPKNTHRNQAGFTGVQDRVSQLLQPVISPYLSVLSPFSDLFPCISLYIVMFTGGLDAHIPILLGLVPIYFMQPNNRQLTTCKTMSC